ncbi:MAG: hypothetical protein OEW39_17160, partial [Deltaproteobacteria bacterium]|nr:hypothetical protein [Deltaproteobacteria bacterium]
DSKTLSENFQIVRDSVLTSSQGFIKRYKVLSEGMTPDQQNFKVRISATVEEKLLEDRLGALRLLHKQMGHKRILVVYHSDNPNALERTHGANRSALIAIRDDLNRAGFNLFNEQAVEKVQTQVEGAKGKLPVSDLVILAQEQRADILFRFENVAGKRGSKEGMFASAYSTLRISAFDTNTGRQMADAQAEGKVLLKSNAGPYDWEKGLSDAASKAAHQATQETISRILDYYKQVGDTGVSFLLVFKGFNDDEKDHIMDFLENTPGFQKLSELKNTPDYLELEMYSSEEDSRLRRLIRAGLKEKGINLQTLETTRNRMEFANLNKPQ